MRASTFALAAILTAGALVGAAAPARATDLNSVLDTLANAFPGGSAVWVADPSRPDPLYARDADRSVLAASLYKLAVLAEAERQVDLGLRAYTDPVTIDPEDITEDGSYFYPGDKLTLDEALEAMITVSDNGTALKLWRTLGPEQINKTLAANGISGFNVALDWDDDNLVTARGVGTLLTRLAQRQLVSAQASDRMIARLGRQTINDRLPAQLPAGTVVAHKTGNLVGAVHDAGIVFTQRGQRVIVALTWDADDQAADEFIAQLAETVYTATMSLVIPVSVRYRLPIDVDATVGSTQTVSVVVENSGQDAWTVIGPKSVGLVWELRDSAGTVVGRSAKPLTVGAIRAGGRATIPVVVTMPPRSGEARLSFGLADASGMPLASAGVATSMLVLKVHDPYPVSAEVKLPSILHRREA
ncbi:MAG: serine hydrolase, partial [Chloroflexi bacterium]|nr:serine hydrolase [Chloroflexota bacterium]